MEAIVGCSETIDRRRSRSLRRRVVVGSVCACLLISAHASYTLYTGSKRALREQLRERLTNVASVSASQIDGDLLGQIHIRSDESKPAFRALRAQLHKIKAADDSARFIYIMRKGDSHGMLRFVIDESSESDAGRPGDSYDAQKAPQMLAGFQKPCADRDITGDQWGYFLSGYAPITDSHGRVQGILGIDMCADKIRADEAAFRKSAKTSAAMAVAIALALALIGARSVIGRIRVFTDAATRIEEGDLDFRMRVPWKDETGELADMFNRMICGLKESRDRLIEGTSRDFLTGLYNHMYFHTRLQDEIARAKRHDRQLSVLMMDLDRFKCINDTLGHIVGDSAVAQLAEVIRQSVREIDIPVRYGGDEFAVILPDTDHEQALLAAERIRASVEAHTFLAIPVGELSGISASPRDSKPLRLTITIGAATYPADHASKDGLAMAADIALCRAKHVSRNSVIAYKAPEGEDGMDPQDLYNMLHSPSKSAVASLTAAIDAKDSGTSGHSERVSWYAQEIAGALSAGQPMIDGLRIAGLLHDLGKMGVSEAVLNKPGSLSQQERAEVRKHPVIGGNMLRRTPHMDQVIPAIVFHHERWDGLGYPDGLKGEAIPLMARIMAVADSFDAMTSDRPYRKAMAVEAALAELQTGAGTQFDPRVVEAFVERFRDSEEKAA